MVDTTLRPRPTFSTFLQSDNSTNDGLSYYDYQRLVRSKKVALLQEKKQRSYEPGYKKPNDTSHSGPVSRKIFELKTKSPTETNTVNVKAHVQGDASASKAEFLKSSLKPDLGLEKFSINVDPESKEAGTQSDRLPRIKQRVRMVKSATARDYRVPSPQPRVERQERPKSVCGYKDFSRQSQSAIGTGADAECQTESIERAKTPVPHKRAYTDEPAHLIDVEDSVDALARAYTWRTSSQRATDEIGWDERIPSPPTPAPASTVEQFPDPVSMRLTFRRYNSEPAGWQSFGAEWDSVQTRPGIFTKGPQGINYSSSSFKTQQIPGYYGHTGRSELLVAERQRSHPRCLVRSVKPRPTTISKRANIPGYTGCVHWTSVAPAHSHTALPEPTTSARTHRHIPLDEERSPYSRTGVFSKMVKTVSPYNPYNKIDP